MSAKKIYKKKPSKISPEFLKWLDSFNKKYAPALKVESKQLNIEQISKWLKEHSKKVIV